MATATTGSPLTPLASLFDTVIRESEGVNLPTWLAMHRAPGTGWKTYDQLAAWMAEAAQRPVNRVTMKTFAETTFGIPDTRYVTVDGRSTAMPRPADADAIAAYINALNPNVVDITKVADYAGEALGRHLATVATEMPPAAEDATE
jgi:hypothetical protein